MNANEPYITNAGRTIKPVPLDLLPNERTGGFVLVAERNGITHVVAFECELFCFN